MKKPDRIRTATETLDILNKQWATKQDIQYLAFVGENKAGEMVKEISAIVGKKLPKGLYPMSVVKDYLGIDVNYLKKIERS